MVSEKNLIRLITTEIRMIGIMMDTPKAKSTSMEQVIGMEMNSRVQATISVLER